MPRGSKDLAEMAERMRAVGYDEHEIAEEVELAQAMQRENAENTILLKETGAYSPPNPPIFREAHRNNEVEQQQDTKVILYADLPREQRALVDSESDEDRTFAAQHGLGLDKLVNDSEWMVRSYVADQGYGLEQLASDPHWMVRETVAHHGIGLDKLVDDTKGPVRAAVAKQGFGLEKLVDDPDWVVRVAVAKQGYGLDKLANDANLRVQIEYAKTLAELDIDIDDWIAENPDKCALVENKQVIMPAGSTLRVEVINSYQRNNGIQRTATIPLPATADEMHSALVAAGVYDPEHEELEIIGVQGLSVDLASVGEGTADLAELNTLAKMISLNPRTATNAQAAIELRDMQVKDVEELMNVIASADELPYHPYEYPLKGRTDEAGSPYDLTWSPERKYGETMLFLDAFSPLSHLLTEHPEIEHAFDIEEFGRQMSEGGDVLGADGYFEDADISIDLTSRYTYEDLREQIEAQWEVMHQDEPVEMVDRPVEEMEGYAAMLDTLREDPALVNLERGTVLTTYPDAVKGREGQPFIASADPNYLAKLVICAEDLQQWARDQIGRHNCQDGMPADALTERASWLSDGTAALKEFAESTLGPEGMANLREDRFITRGALEACELARKDRALEGDALSPNEESSRLKAITEAISNVGKKAKERVAPTI